MSIEQQLTDHLTARADQIASEPAWDDLSARARRATTRRRAVLAMSVAGSVALVAAAVIPLTRDGGEGARSIRTAAAPLPPITQDIWEPVEHHVTGEVEVLQSGVDSGVAWEVFAFPTNLGPCYGVRDPDPAKRPPNPFMGFPTGAYRCLPSGGLRTTRTRPIGLSAYPPKRNKDGFELAAPFDIRLLSAREGWTLKVGGGQPRPLVPHAPRFDPDLRLVVIAPMPVGTKYQIEQTWDGRPSGSLENDKVKDWIAKGPYQSELIVARSARDWFKVGFGTGVGRVCQGVDRYPVVAPRPKSGLPLQVAGRGSSFGCGSRPRDQHSWGGSPDSGYTLSGVARVRITFFDGTVIETNTFACDTGLDVCFFGVDRADDSHLPTRVEGFASDGSRVFDSTTDPRLQKLIDDAG